MIGKIRTISGSRCLLATAIALIAWIPGAAAGDDFDILPLAPLVTQEEEDVPMEEMPEAEEPVAEIEELEEAEPARPAPRAQGGISMIVGAGGYMGMPLSVPMGIEIGAAVELPLALRGLHLRVESSWSTHRVEEARILPGLGMDEGFTEVVGVAGLRAGAAWKPLGSGSGPFVSACVGASMTRSHRRVFSEESRGTRLRPSLSLGLGMDIGAGPGSLRIETALRGVDLVIGPDDSPVARAYAGTSIALAYRIEI